MPLPDLLQLLSAMRKNGVLRLQNDRREAVVYLREGRIIFTELVGNPEIHPEKAAYRILTWNAGTFVLEPATDRQFDAELEFSTEALVMEAMQLFDELEHIRHKLPDISAMLSLKRPLAPPLRSLTPELLDTLQLVMNHGVVEAVLNHSGAPDLDTLQDVEYLLKNGYVELVQA
jgi:hypothetical protein